MNHQNYKNHCKFVIGYHGLSLLAILAFLGGTIRNFYKSSEDNLYPSYLLILLAFILLL